MGLGSLSGTHHTLCYKHSQQFTGQFPGSTLTCYTCWAGGGKKKSMLTDFLFLTDSPVVLIFSFPPVVPRLVYNLSNHPNTCVYV